MLKNSNDNPEMFRSCPKLPEGWYWRLASSGSKLILSIRKSGSASIGDPRIEKLMSMTTMQTLTSTASSLYGKFQGK